MPAFFWKIGWLYFRIAELSDFPVAAPGRSLPDAAVLRFPGQRPVELLKTGSLQSGRLLTATNHLVPSSISMSTMD